MGVPMRAGLLALAVVVAAPMAHAQVIIQAPPIPGVTVPVGPPPGPPGPPPGYGPGYWREGGDWRRRAEFREAEHRRWEWRRAHCVRGYDGGEYCRP